MSITNDIVSSKIYDKRDYFNFEIVNFPFLDGDVPRSPFYGVFQTNINGIHYVILLQWYTLDHPPGAVLVGTMFFRTMLQK